MRKKILVIANEASWHNWATSKEPENISITKLPPYSPELSPIERVFEYMKQKLIKYKLWTSLSELQHNIIYKYMIPDQIKAFAHAIIFLFKM